MICTTYFLTFFSELIPPTGKYLYPYIYIRNTCTSIIPDKKKSLGIYNIKPLDLIV